MTVESLVNTVEFTGDGVETSIPFDFRLIAAEDLVITVTDLDDVETTLVLGDDYTIDGVGDYEGGTIELEEPLPEDYELLGERSPARTNPLSLTDQGPLSPADIGVQLDRMVMMIQSLHGRQVTGPVGTAELTAAVATAVAAAMSGYSTTAQMNTAIAAAITAALASYATTASVTSAITAALVAAALAVDNANGRSGGSAPAVQTVQNGAAGVSWHVLGQRENATAMSSETATVTLDYLYAIPFFVPRRVKIDRMGNYNGTLSAGDEYRLGIYAPTSAGDLYPGALLLDSGVIDGSASEWLPATVDVTLNPGNCYWAVAIFKQSKSVRCNSRAQLLNVLGFVEPLPGIQDGPRGPIRHAQAYGALPATFPIASPDFILSGGAYAYPAIVARFAEPS